MCGQVRLQRCQTISQVWSGGPNQGCVGIASSIADQWRSRGFGKWGAVRRGACGYVPGAIASCESVQRKKRDHNNNDCRAPEMCFTGVAAQSLLPCIVCYCNSFCMVPPAPSRWDRADPAETEKGEGKKNQGVPNYWVVPGHHPGDVETSFGPYWTQKNLRLYEVTFAGLYTSKRGYGDGWVEILKSPEKIWTERKVLVAYIQRNGGDGYLCKSCKMFLLWWKWTIHTGLFCHYSSKQCGTLFVDVAVLGSNTNHFATAWPTLRCQDFNECLCIWMYLGLVIWYLILGRMYETFTQRQTHTHTHTYTHIYTYIHAYTHLDWTSKHHWCHGMII